MGKRPIPDAIKQVKGTLRKCRAIDNIAQPILLQNVPLPPNDFNENERKMWSVICNWLNSVNLLNEVDLYAVIMLCKEMEMYNTAIENIKQFGMITQTKKGAPMLNPYMKIKYKSMQQLNILMGELGMTPVARQKLRSNVEDKKANPIAELIKKREQKRQST
jgi:P27 family predicted phage terminase small subunit